ncbi:MAG: GNAT family N-acetyltransferase [Candidatus Saccharibacteria bacterium]
MDHPLTIDTEENGVYLKQLVPEDIVPYFDVIDSNREYLSRFSGKVVDRYPTLSSLEESFNETTDSTPDQVVRFGIWNKDMIVGSMELRPKQNEAEIGYWLGHNHTGNGYATVALRSLCDYAKQRFSVLNATVDEKNERSARVLERVGFQERSRVLGYLIFKMEGIQPVDSKA